MAKLTKDKVFLAGGIISTIVTPFLTKWADRKSYERTANKTREKYDAIAVGETLSEDQLQLTRKEKLIAHLPYLAPIASTAISIGCQIGLYSTGKHNEAILNSALSMATNAAQMTINEAEKHMSEDDFKKLKRDVDEKLDKVAENGAKTVQNGPIIANMPMENVVLWLDPISGVFIRSSFADLQMATTELVSYAQKGCLDGDAQTDISYGSWLDSVPTITRPSETFCESLLWENGEGCCLRKPTRFDLYLTENYVPYGKLQWEKEPKMAPSKR